MDRDHRVDTALFRQLLDLAAIPLIGSLLAATLVAIAQWRQGNGVQALHWVFLVCGVTVIRAWLTIRCRAKLATGYQERSARTYALTTGLSGFVWGVAGLFVIHANAFSLIITITAILGMVMGGVLTLGAFLTSFFAFALPATLPMVVALAWRGGNEAFLLSVYTFGFVLLLMGIARRYHTSLRRSWQLSFDKEDLLGELTAAHDRLSILAEIDGLTGLANRRRFDEVLEAEFARLRRSGGALSLIMLDVDHFKNYNDTYGHVAGDACLKRLAEVFRGFLNRAPDLAARYGGEEFTGVLPETGHEGARSVAENIRAEIEALKIPHAASPTADHVTVSLGVITVNCAELRSAAVAVSLADRELYRAKTAGRNRVSARLASPRETLM